MRSRIVRNLARLSVGLAALLVAAAVWIWFGLTHQADLAPYARLAPSQATPGRLRVTFLGVSTLLFDDGETQIMTDGFFSRPNPKQLFLQKITPDEAVIDKSLARAGVSKLAALVVVHSHYDHAMDAAVVANRTGAILVGSSSTANVARGGDVPEDRIKTPAIGEALRFGKFRVTLLPSGHVPTGYPNGAIAQPLRPPARADAYKLGEAFAVLIEHDGRTLLVNASAGFQPRALAGLKVDTVFLGIGQLGRKGEVYMADYWRETVAATQARRVVVVHWDNFGLPLDQPLQPIPNLLDDMDASMRFLQTRSAAEGVQIVLPQSWRDFDAFRQ